MVNYIEVNRKAYNILAQEYDDRKHEIGDDFWLNIYEKIPLSKYDALNVLEIGPGNGRNLGILSKYNEKFDISKSNDIGITFIPAEDMIHCYFKLDEIYSFSSIKFSISFWIVLFNSKNFFIFACGIGPFLFFESLKYSKIFVSSS